MVTNVTSLTRSGLWDWVIQRVTAVVLLLYTLCVWSYLLVNPGLTRADLVSYFGNGAMQIFTTLAVFSVAAHGWIGMWTVGTDYLQPHYFGKIATSARFVYQLVCGVALFVYVVWGLQIVWSL